VGPGNFGGWARDENADLSNQTVSAGDTLHATFTIDDNAVASDISPEETSERTPYEKILTWEAYAEVEVGSDGEVIISSDARLTSYFYVNAYSGSFGGFFPATYSFLEFGGAPGFDTRILYEGAYLLGAFPLDMFSALKPFTNGRVGDIDLLYEPEAIGVGSDACGVNASRGIFTGFAVEDQSISVDFGQLVQGRIVQFSDPNDSMDSPTMDFPTRDMTGGTTAVPLPGAFGLLVMPLLLLAGLGRRQTEV